MLKIELIANFFLKHKGIKKIINNKNFNIVIFYKPPKKSLPYPRSIDTNIDDGVGVGRSVENPAL